MTGVCRLYLQCSSFNMGMHAAFRNSSLASCNLNSNTKSNYFIFRTHKLNAYLVPMSWKKQKKRLEEEGVCMCVFLFVANRWIVTTGVFRFYVRCTFFNTGNAAFIESKSLACCNLNSIIESNYSSSVHTQCLPISWKFPSLINVHWECRCSLLRQRNTVS